MSKPIPAQLADISLSFKESILSEQEIMAKMYDGLHNICKLADVHIFLIDNKRESITDHFSHNGTWMIPKPELKWLIKEWEKEKNASPPKKHYFIENRNTFHFSDKQQVKLDQSRFNYPCNDILYALLTSEDENIIGVVMAANWSKKKNLLPKKDRIITLAHIESFLKTAEVALDNLFIHQRIEKLLSDKKNLERRIQEDEESLKRRILELTVLYDTSTTLGYTFEYDKIVNATLESIFKVLEIDICNIFLLEFTPHNELVTHVNCHISDDELNNIQNNVISSIMPFTHKIIDPKIVSKNVKLRKKSREESYKKFSTLTSFANVPLIFKEDVIGIITICSSAKQSFSRSEMTFLHTMANQLSAHLGKLKVIKALETSKINSMIHSMSESIMMLNSSNQIEIINPSAETVLGITPSMKENPDLLLDHLKAIGIKKFYDSVQKTGRASLNKEIHFKEKVIETNISQVKDAKNSLVGTVIVLRDITEIEKINRTKAQRLEIISKIDSIITSITDLDKLLEVLMEFIISISNAEMGSIQLLNKDTQHFYTQVHSNFPDKIREMYKLKNGKTISETVIENKSMCFIPNYFEDPNANPNVKILIDTYLCLPIIVKNELIGVINIVRKFGNPHEKINSDDIQTISTIASLMGSSIHNALLYKGQLEKQNLEQELRVAHSIQQRLLPDKAPTLETASIAALSIPARKIAGDYYDFFKLPGNKIGIILADIVGKGVPAGLFMALLKSILHSSITQFETPDKALEKINHLLVEDPVIDRFIPIFYCILDLNTNILSYTNAGLEPGLHLANGTIKTLDTEGFPPGGSKESRYTKKTIQLEKGDKVVLFTDGITESRNKNNKMFGVTRLKKAIKTHQKHPVKSLIKKIHDDVKQFTGSENLNDDFTTIAIQLKHKKKPQKESILHQDRIEVMSSKSDVKVVRKFIDNFGKKAKIPSSTLFDIKLAINEAQCNIIEHVYFNKDDGKIVITFTRYEKRVKISVKDFGHTIKQKTIKGKETHLIELEGSGLGVYLINTLMDEVNYKQLPKIGTELTLIKKL